MRRVIALIWVISACLGAAAAAQAQSSAPLTASAAAKTAFKPNGPVTIVVPYSPGGGTDQVGRLIAKALAEMWNQTVIVDNRTGGNGSVGAIQVARSAPDGHTLVLAVSGIAINAHLMNLPYDTATAFAPVTAVAYPASTLIATPSLPANDLKELQALVKKEGPDKRTFASPDPGSRLTAERVFDVAGIKLLNVPYKGAASFVLDVSAGRVDIGISSVTSALSLLQSGKLKALGIMGTERVGIMPNLKTFKEQGFDGLDDNSWYGLFAPAGTPPAVVKAIQTDIVTALNTPEIKAKLYEMGALAGGDTPEAFNARFQRDLKESGETIKRIGMKAE